MSCPHGVATERHCMECRARALATENNMLHRIPAPLRWYRVHLSAGINVTTELQAASIDRAAAQAEREWPGFSVDLVEPVR